MAKKKARWRQGIVVLREGKPDKPATEDIAKRYNRLAALERDPDREIQLLKQSKVVGILGRINERLVDLSTYRPGRPKGSTREQEDAAALAFMEKVFAETGEKRPYRLARLAVEAGLVPVRGTEKARMDRLAGRWKRRIQKK
jgi:hypothetical protein